MRTVLALVAWLLGSAGFAFAAADIVLDATDAKVTPPMTLVDGVLQQPTKIELPASGTAIFALTIPEDGEYQVLADVYAPSGDANSFYVNFDAPPEDPRMIWDIFLKTDEFVERAVTWRGNGGRDDPEFDPKFFHLTAGAHRLIVAGREPAKLRRVTIRRYFKPEPGAVGAMEEAAEAIPVRARHELAALEDTPAGREAADQIFRQADADAEKLRQQAIDLAETKPGTPNSVALLTWVLRSGRAAYLPSGPRALALVNQQYALDPEIGPVVAYYAHYLPYPSERVHDGIVELFGKAVAKNPNRVVRGQAALGLANFSKREFDELEYRRQGEAVELTGRKAIAAMEAVRRDYGDVPYLRHPDVKITLGEEAARQLVELRTLRVGMPAPEIADTDLNGERFKLSDYRGKVVMLVFWGTWCGPCMAAVPHERALVEKFKERPFAIVGVNSDARPERALKAVAAERMSWRSFWDGTDSHLSKAWNVKAWPTVYLIDHRGTIRQRMFARDEIIEELVADAERPSASQ